VVDADLAAAAGPASLVAAAGDRIDTLVNNVGSAPARTRGFLAVTDEEWLATLNINLMAAVRATRAALPAMLAAGTGAIVNMCSVNSVFSDRFVIDYSAAKAALASFSKALSKEVGERASGSTRSARDPWPPTCGSAIRASRRRSVTPRARRRKRWHASSPPPHPPVVQHPGRGRCPGGGPGQRCRGQHHRLRHSHRRRPYPDMVEMRARSIAR
jgi:hypothetical protein